jgi:ParB-like chromosome segregation protein Spo0J
MKDYEFHPVAELFPLMEGRPFAELVADILAQGLKEKIWLHDGKIIDGRNRYRACKEAGVEPEFREWDGKGSLVAFVCSLNLHRRHLDESQRAMIAAQISNIPQGVRSDRAAKVINLDIRDAVCVDPVTVEEAAKMMGVGRESVQMARVIRRDGDESLVDAVTEGKISIRAAKKVAKLPKPEQQRIASQARASSTRRRNLSIPPSLEEVDPMNGNKDIRVNLNTNDPASAAAMLAERLEPDFLEKLHDALTPIIQRRRNARERGLAPAAKGH